MSFIGYTEEKEILRQFEGLMDTIDVNEISIKDKIKDEVQRFKKFNQFVLGSKEKFEIGDIDIRIYCKYILRNGTEGEKRELLGGIKSKILLSEKKIRTGELR